MVKNENEKKPYVSLIEEIKSIVKKLSTDVMAPNVDDADLWHEERAAEAADDGGEHEDEQLEVGRGVTRE